MVVVGLKPEQARKNTSARCKYTGVDSGAYQLDKVGDFLNEFLTSLTDGRIEESIGEFSKGTRKFSTISRVVRQLQEDVLNAVIGEMGTMTDKTKEASLASTLWSSLGEDNALGMIEALGNVPNSYENIKGATDEAAESTMGIGTNNGKRSNALYW